MWARTSSAISKYTGYRNMREHKEDANLFFVVRG